jgi:hypothetical protein
MKRLLIVLAALVLSCSTAFADVTVTVTVSINAGQMAADGTMISFAKGTKFRADTSMAGQNITLLSDAAAKQQWMINHATKQIEPFSAQQGMAGIPVTFGETKSSVKASGQTREIMGLKCEGFTVEVTVPMTLGGETIILRMTGPAWVAKEGAGVTEFKAAQKAFTDIGMATSLMGQGPQGKAMADLTKALGDTGVVMEQEIQMTMEGTGQMAQMMGQMGTMTTTMKVTAISTDAIPDSKFALPEGYTKK